MGIPLKEEVASVRHVIDMDDLHGQKIGVDTFNYLYASLYATKTPDGRPLEFGGKVTSHIAFFFYKTVQLFELGIKPVYIFDGEKSVLKHDTMAERKKSRDDTRELANQAKERGDIDLYNRLMTQSQSVEPYMIDDLKRLFTCFGIPWVQAPGEGEAQGSYMCASGDLFGIASQDYDCLLFGTKVFLRNIFRAKTTRVYGKEIVNDKEKIILSEVLDHVGLTREQLVDVAILSGTDFNPGVPKVGIKTAIKYIRKYGSIDRTIENVERVRANLTKGDASQVRAIFLDPRVTAEYSLKFSMPKFGDIVTMMRDEFGFSESVVKPKMLGLQRTIQIRNQGAVAKL
jgi:flap endonuclease-1